MAGGIFISYRRSDIQGAAGRLYDGLRHLFLPEQIFMDVASIEPGLNFVEVITEKISTVEAMLVLIGPRWLATQDDRGTRRLDNPNDPVRLEVAAALERKIRVIPVLVDEAKMPSASDLPEPLKPLSLRNATTVAHATFQDDVNRLGAVLVNLVEPKELRLRAAELDRDRRAQAVTPLEPSILAISAIWMAMFVYPIGLILLLLCLNKRIREFARRRGYWDTGKRAAIGSVLLWIAIALIGSR